MLIHAGAVALAAELNDGPTADALWAALPIEGRANRWGDEIYFDIPVTAREEPSARTEMAVGEVAYWPPGSAFCIFFGPTPVSHGSEPRAYSPVNPVGRVDGDATRFRGVSQGAPVSLTRAETE
jgi:hypothetical protein